MKPFCLRWPCLLLVSALLGSCTRSSYSFLAAGPGYLKSGRDSTHEQFTCVSKAQIPRTDSVVMLVGPQSATLTPADGGKHLATHPRRLAQIFHLGRAHKLAFKLRQPTTAQAKHVTSNAALTNSGADGIAVIAVFYTIILIGVLVLVVRWIVRWVVRKLRKAKPKH
jgi:hypothetical protein